MSSINTDADVTTTVNEAPNSSQTDLSKDLSSSFTLDINQSAEMIELNNRIRSDLMSQCSEFLRDDDEGRQCVERVWKKYLRCVGDAATVHFQIMTNSFLFIVDSVYSVFLLASGIF